MRLSSQFDNIFFTSDTHFYHDRVIEYSNRPFSSTEEMNEEMIKRWNNKVGPRDIVFHCGDFAFGRAEQITNLIKRLNGQIHLIKGNHDYKTSRSVFSNFASVREMREIRIDTHKIFLCHYAMAIWPSWHHGAWHLFGHSHGNFEGFGKSRDVGVDTTEDYAPIKFQEIKEYMDGKEIYSPENLRD